MALVYKHVDFETGDLREVGGSGQTQLSYRELVMSMGPGAYFRLNESVTGTVVDEVGLSSGVHAGGAAAGATGALAREGGRAVSLPVFGASVQTDFVGYAGAQARSVVVWAQLMDQVAGDRSTLVHWGQAVLGRKWSLVLDTSRRVRLEISGGAVNGETAVPMGEWVMIACTFSGTKLSDTKLYLNGELEPHQSSSSVAVNTLASAMEIGLQFGALHRWQGELDELAVFDRALTAAEVHALYERGIGRLRMGEV